MRNGAALATRGEKFPFGAGQQDASGGFVESELRCELFDRGRDPENIFRRVVVHFAVGLHVVVKFDRARFFGREHGANFVERPGEIVAVVVERLVGVLAAVEAAALLIRENVVDPGNDSFGGFAEERRGRVT